MHPPFPVLLRTTSLATRTWQCIYYFVPQAPPCATLFVPQGLHKILPSTTLHCKACTTHFPSTTLYCKACTKYFSVWNESKRSLKRVCSRLESYFVLQSLRKILPSTTRPTTPLYYNPCTKYFPVLTCTTSWQQVLHSTTLYYKRAPPSSTNYKACAKYLPVLLCTTKLAQSTSQYYFVLQSLHTVLPSPKCVWDESEMTLTWLWNSPETSLKQAWKLLQTLHTILPSFTSIAQSTSQHYFVLQDCTKYFPVLLCTTRLVQSSSTYLFALPTKKTRTLRYAFGKNMDTLIICIHICIHMNICQK